jgi:hypothetical protein
MTPHPIPRGDLHARLPSPATRPWVAYAEREGISLNTALWLLVRRGLEHEGIRVEMGGRRSAPAAPMVDVEAVAGAAVERAVADVKAAGRPPAGPVMALGEMPRGCWPKCTRRVGPMDVSAG